MSCPYPNCGKPVETWQTHCFSCNDPLFSCSLCDTANRAFARYCRHCKHPLTSSQSQKINTRLSSERSRRQIELVNLGQIRGLQPDLIIYGGYLWGITLDGVLYRISGNSKPEKVGIVPGRGFSFPLAMEEDEKEGATLYANNEKAAFKFRIFDKQHEEILRLGEPDVFRSSVLRAAGNFYFLCQAGNDGPLKIKRVGSVRSEHVLENSRPLKTLTQPIHRAGKSVWVLMTEGAYWFDGSSPLAAHEKISWQPWNVLPSRNGVWYSTKTDSGDFGQRQKLVKLVSDGHELAQSDLRQDISITAKLAVDAETGELAVLSSESIQAFDFDQRIAGFLPTDIIDINNPEAALLTSGFLFWLETKDRTVYVWTVGTRQARPLFSIAESVPLSRLFYNNGSLFGLSNEEVLRWDLLDA